MGYATRKSGDPNGSLQYYTRRSPSIPSISALTSISARLLPDARPAGRRPQQQLARLDPLGVFGCTEYRVAQGRYRHSYAGRGNDSLARRRLARGRNTAA